MATLNKEEKGMGLLLGIILSLFMIGIVVMIILIGNSGIKNSQTTTNTLLNNQNVPIVANECLNLSISGDIQSNNLVIKDSYGTVLPSSQYTVVGGCVKEVP